jgi:HTH-type transcriptional regulator/antitoxin HigA
MTTLTTQTHGRFKLGHTFAKLLQRFPLWKISTEAQYDLAIAVLQDLIGRDDLNSNESAYLDSLTILIKEYESRAYPFDTLAKNRTPLHLLKHLMEANDMTQADLAKLFNSPSGASMVLRGQRPISLPQARLLAARFHVDIGLFVA